MAILVVLLAAFDLGMPIAALALAIGAWLMGEATATSSLRGWRQSTGNCGPASHGHHLIDLIEQKTRKSDQLRGPSPRGKARRPPSDQA